MDIRAYGYTHRTYADAVERRAVRPLRVSVIRYGRVQRRAELQEVAYLLHGNTPPPRAHHRSRTIEDDRGRSRHRRLPLRVGGTMASAASTALSRLRSIFQVLLSFVPRRLTTNGSKRARRQTGTNMASSSSVAHIRRVTGAAVDINGRSNGVAAIVASLIDGGMWDVTKEQEERCDVAVGVLRFLRRSHATSKIG